MLNFFFEKGNMLNFFLMILYGISEGSKKGKVEILVKTEEVRNMVKLPVRSILISTSKYVFCTNPIVGSN